MFLYKLGILIQWVNYKNPQATQDTKVKYFHLYLFLLTNSYNSFLISKGKEEFERQQKELLEKENIMKQNKVQLGQEQVGFWHTVYFNACLW